MTLIEAPEAEWSSDSGGAKGGRGLAGAAGVSERLHKVNHFRRREGTVRLPEQTFTQGLREWVGKRRREGI
jgi:hypothetical protein